MAGLRTHELGISGEVVAPVVRALAELGFDAEAESKVMTVGPVVNGSQADGLLDRAAAVLGQPALGLVLARLIPLGALGVLDYALCTSALLRDGLRRLSHHYGVVTQRVTLSLVDDSAAPALLFERRTNISHSRHWIEFSFAMIARRIRQTTRAEVRFPEVAFSHADAGSRPAWQAFFGGQVQFGAQLDRLGLEPGSLELPLTTASEALATLLDQRICELEPHQGDALKERVRRTVVAQLDRRVVGLEPAARALGMGTRTLQRELKTRKTSYSAIVDEVRRERSLRLLEEGRTMAETAYYLAFADPSAFFRAYRRWTGTGPRPSH